MGEYVNMSIVEPLNEENIGIRSTCQAVLISEVKINWYIFSCPLYLSYFRGFLSEVLYCIMLNAGITSYIICCVLGIDWIFILTLCKRMCSM